MPLDQAGVKWSCEPCVRGHRSSKCEHYERVMVRVKKPGRPLSSCPHPAGSCACGDEKMMMVKIQTNTGCVCEPRFYVTPEGEHIPVGPNSSSENGAMPNQPMKKPKEKAHNRIADELPTNAAQGQWPPSQRTLPPNHQHPSAHANGSVRPEILPASLQSLHSAHMPFKGLSADWMTSEDQKSNSPHQGAINYGGDLLNNSANGYVDSSPSSSDLANGSQPFGNGFESGPAWSSSAVPGTDNFGPYDTSWIQHQHTGHDLDSRYKQNAMQHLYNGGPVPNGAHQPMSTMHGIHEHLESCEQCTCGDGCSCYACSTHPFNDATTSRLKEIQAILDDDLEEDRPSSSASPFDFGSGIPSPSGGNFINPAQLSQFSTPQPTHAAMVEAHAHENASLPYQNFVYRFDAAESFRNAAIQNQPPVAPETPSCCCSNDEDMNGVSYQV